MSKKLVLFIPSIESGGVEKNFFNICNFLSHHYKKIFVITSDTKFKNNFEKNVILISPKSNYWAKKGRLKKTIISLFLLIKHFFNQEVVVFSFQSNIIAIVISKILGFKILIRLNTSVRKYIKGIIKKNFFKFFYKLSDEIIVNSKYFKRELSQILYLNSVLIYNPSKLINKKKKN